MNPGLHALAWFVNNWRGLALAAFLCLPVVALSAVLYGFAAYSGGPGAGLAVALPVAALGGCVVGWVLRP